METKYSVIQQDKMALSVQTRQINPPVSICLCLIRLTPMALPLSGSDLYMCLLSF